MISAHLIPIIFKLCGEERAVLDPRQKDMIALPQVETGDLLIGNPLQGAFAGIDQFSRELCGGVHEDIPIVSLEIGEQQQPMQTWIFDDKPGFLQNLAPDTFLRCFACLELPSQPVSFVFVNIIRLFIAIDHQCLSMVFDVT